jgi:2,4-dienoyl-CoA reductase-like NADH-dependent reductase (Old Yellow Enzyme family)
VNNTPHDAHITYRVTRARGGVSLIVTEIAQIEERAIYSSNALRIVSDDQIPGYRRLADSLHGEGARVLVQVFHPGREMHKQGDGRLAVAWVPSEVSATANRVMPRPMSVAEIRQTIEQFGTAAERLERADVDGFEIVAAHGFLPSQFLNPLVNTRSDDYGGTFENRLRFLRELVATIRAATQPEFVVGLRICADEGHAQGLDLETSVHACAGLDRGGLLDYFSIAYGTVSDSGGALGMISPMGGDHSDIAHYSCKIREVVARPVFVAGRINQMAHAADIVSSGIKAAAVATARGHHVTLYERTERLGGQVLLAEKLPSRSEFGGIVPNLEREMTRSGVKIVLRTPVDRVLVETEQPDVIVVATGGRLYRPTIEGQEAVHVVDAWSVLRGEANVGSRVVNR